MIWSFIKKISYCFNPSKYESLKNEGSWKSYKFMLKALLLAFIIAGLFFIPKYIDLRSEIVNDISKIKIINISGRIETKEAISIPSQDPLLTIDLQENKNMEKEIFLINKDEVQFRFFGKRKIALDKLKNPLEHKQEVGTFVTSIILLLTPGILFILYLKIAIKYLLIALLFATLIFFLIDLTNYKLKFKKVLVITAYASVPIILIETIIAVINPKILFPFMRFIGLNLYAVTLTIWFFYIIICIIIINKRTKNE